MIIQRKYRSDESIVKFFQVNKSKNKLELCNLANKVEIIPNKLIKVPKNTHNKLNLKDIKQKNQKFINKMVYSNSSR